ncbi:endonuclease [Clostridium botulinum]|nr:endonuclease [Clostridium botulinum]NFP00055.1 endonuclease [Clostridium botulinum]
MKMKVVGIYGIEDVKTGNIYVGQSKDIAKRWSNHVSFMKKGEYRYTALQEAYSDDSKRIKFTILEECTVENLADREDFWIKHVQKVDGWNLINKQKHGGATRTIRDTSKMKAAQTGMKNGNCRLSVEDVKEIKNLLNEGIKIEELAKQYCVSPTHISNIKLGKRWSSVEV